MVKLTSASAWMIVISTLLMAVVAHGLLSYLIVIMNVGMMIVTREISAMEQHRRCWPCMAMGGGIIFIALLIMLKINWLAI